MRDESLGQLLSSSVPVLHMAYCTSTSLITNERDDHQLWFTRKHLKLTTFHANLVVKVKVRVDKSRME